VDSGERDADAGRVDTNAGTEVKERLVAKQRREAFVFPPLPDDVHFTETTFPAMLKPSGVRFNNHGDVEVVLVIPARYREQIVPLGYAMRTPLLVNIERWRNLDLEENDG
jgi:hypothetical protein